MRNKIIISVSLILIAVLSGLLLNFDIDIGKSDSDHQKALTLGFKDSLTITIGLAGQAYAASPDYTCDGTADDVQFQAALNALPASGGKLTVLTGQYNFASTVTRAIGNVVIEGNGYSTYLVYNGALPLFTAGGSNWVFQDIRFDAGFVTANTDTQVLRCWDGATYYAAYTNSSADNWNIPTGRGATFIVAASNADAQSIAQADYVCDGTADQSEINTALNTVAANGGTVKLSNGTFITTAAITISGSTTLDLGEATIAPIAGSTHYVIVNKNYAGTGDDNFIVKNGTIDYSGGAAGGYGMYFEHCNHIHIDDVNILEPPYNGIHIYDVNYSIFSNNYLYNCGQDAALASDFAAASFHGSNLAPQSNYNEFIGNIVTYGKGYQYYVQGEGNVITNNMFMDSNSIAISIGAANKSNNVTSNRIFNAGDNAIDVNGGTGHAITNNIIVNPATTGIWAGHNKSNAHTITGNNIEGAGGHGISSGDGASNITIGSNTIVESTTHGIYIDGNSLTTGYTISNNTIRDVGDTGIVLQDYVWHSVIDGNQIYSSNSDGIRLRNNCDWNIVTDNNIWDSGYAGIRLFDSGSGSEYNQIINNISIDSGAAVQDYGILTQNNANYNVIRNNYLSGNTAANMQLVNTSTTYLSKNKGFLTVNSGSSTGTNVQQTIAHNLGGDVTPVKADITITMLDSGTYSAYASAKPSSTNIYITGPLGKKYAWRVDTED